MDFIKRFLSILTVIFVIVGCTNGCISTNTARTRSSSEPYIASDINVNHLMNSTIQLVMQNPQRQEQWRSFCSGFFISPTRIATASHCVRQRHEVQLVPGVTIEMEGDPVVGSPYRYRTYSQFMNHSAVSEPFLAHVVAFDAEEDVAVLDISFDSPRSADYLIMNSTNVRVGELTYVVGSPGGMSWLLTNGIVSHLEREDNGTLLRILSTAPVFFGNSGGPLIDSNGHVIGVCSAIAFRLPVYGFHAPIRNVVRLVNGLNRH